MLFFLFVDVYYRYSYDVRVWKIVIEMMYLGLWVIYANAQIFCFFIMWYDYILRLILCLYDGTVVVIVLLVCCGNFCSDSFCFKRIFNIDEIIERFCLLDWNHTSMVQLVLMRKFHYYKISLDTRYYKISPQYGIHKLPKVWCVRTKSTELFDVLHYSTYCVNIYRRFLGTAIFGEKIFFFVKFFSVCRYVSRTAPAASKSRAFITWLLRKKSIERERKAREEQWQRRTKEKRDLSAFFCSGSSFFFLVCIFYCCCSHSTLIIWCSLSLVLQISVGKFFCFKKQIWNSYSTAILPVSYILNRLVSPDIGHTVPFKKAGENQE